MFCFYLIENRIEQNCNYLSIDSIIITISFFQLIELMSDSKSIFLNKSSKTLLSFNLK